MPKVLISDKMSPLAAEIFAERGVEVDVKPGMTPEELIACIGDYDGLAIRSATKVTADLLAAAERLKVVGRAGIGIDNIDLAAATARGVVVMNAPHGNAITTAEHTVALLFALARQIPASPDCGPGLPGCVFGLLPGGQDGHRGKRMWAVFSQTSPCP